jgi:putative transposase
LAAGLYGLDVYWISVLSNHHHDGVRDNGGNYPEFLRYFHSLLARCLNVHLSRWESFWSTEQTGMLHLGDADAVFNKMIYSLTNAVKDHLVDKALNWPGFNSLRYQLADKPVVVKRPSWFFDKNGELPEQVELSFKRPPEFAHLSHQQWTDKIREAVAEQERKAAEQRRREGRSIVGRKAIRRQSPYSCPKTCTERRGLRPRVASRNKRRRIELLGANKRFIERYHDALRRRRFGELDVAFPYGTYKLWVQGVARCDPAPALE